jgi:DNA mismatch repair protein PMS2
MADESAATLKELGDVQNWAEMLERELMVLEDVVGGGGRG